MDQSQLSIKKKFYKSDPEPDFCRFCWNLGLEKKDCLGHRPSDCPRLQNTQCTKCGLVGHTRRFCTAQTCRWCKRIGHIMRECPDLKEHVCLRCGVVGHHETGCRIPICRYCKEPGHVKDECPKMHCSECNNYGHTRRSCPYMYDSRPVTSFSSL
jgi:zinc knuckle protein